MPASHFCFSSKMLRTVEVEVVVLVRLEEEGAVDFVLSTSRRRCGKKEENSCWQQVRGQDSSMAVLVSDDDKLCCSVVVAVA